MVPRTCRISFGVDPSDGPDEAIYSTPLMLRWIARCTSDWIRSGIDVRSRPARLSPALAFIFSLRPRPAHAWCAAACARPDIRLPALQSDGEGLGAPSVLSYPTVATRRSTLRASILPLPRCQRAFCGAKNRVIEASSQYHPASQGNSQGECISPPAAADRPRQRHRPLLRNLRRRRSGADAADHGAGRSDDPLG